jgi:hypothetical protein
MKRIIFALSLAAAAGLGAGCADHYGYEGGYYAGGDGYYSGFYDDYYGPIYDGYWDGDVFYYRDSGDHEFRRDDAHHVRHDQANGYHEFHGAMHGQRPQGAAAHPRDGEPH